VATGIRSQPPSGSDCGATPKHPHIGLHDAAFFTNYSHTALLAIAEEFASKCSGVNRDQLIPRIPLEGASTVRGEGPIHVNGSTYQRFRRRDDDVRRLIWLSGADSEHDRFYRRGRTRRVCIRG
jgi:hypothetical protein